MQWHGEHTCSLAASGEGTVVRKKRRRENEAVGVQEGRQVNSTRLPKRHVRVWSIGRTRQQIHEVRYGSLPATRTQATDHGQDRSVLGGRPT